MHVRATDLAGWLRSRVAAAGARGLVVGLSGGIDSAVVAGLCQLAVPDRVAGVMLPCHSDPADMADARLVAEHFAIRVAAVDLAPAYERLVGDLESAIARLAGPATPGEDSTAGAQAALSNVKPRLRMTSLYFVANTLNYLVAGTGNRCELTIGYFTKHGDGGADLLPIGHLLKSQVRALARDLGVPDAIIEKTPSAGLWPGQTDEADLGFSYADLERYLTGGPAAVAPALALRIERLIRASEHKRTPAPVPDTAGPGRDGWEV
jgi:NAD+ synthase